MDLEELIGNARDAMTVRRVYGEPYEKDGLTIIPAASLRGAIGGGGEEGANQPGRKGGGFAMDARPLGVYVVKDGAVSWAPAFDLNALTRVALLGLAITGLALARALGHKRFSRIASLRRRSGRRRFRAFFAR
jgi:hypothetical protein